MAYYGTIVGKKSLGENLQGSMHLATGSGVLPYTGEYEATPTSMVQIFTTANKRMTDNFTVRETPYEEVSNIYGGYTVTIL